jgi:hypothetical protein
LEGAESRCSANENSKLTRTINGVEYEVGSDDEDDDTTVDSESMMDDDNWSDSDDPKPSKESQNLKTSKPLADKSTAKAKGKSIGPKGISSKELSEKNAGLFTVIDRSVKRAQSLSMSTRSRMQRVCS